MRDRPKRQDLIVGVIDALSLVVEDGLCGSQPHGASGQVVRLAATSVVFR
jgi:hypothetical protein